MVSPPPVLTGRRQQRSTRLVFFIAGFAIASWAPLVPYAKARLDADEQRLGLLLLCLGVGSVVAMPLAGAVSARIGCRPVILLSAVLLCLSLPLLATISSPIALAGALFVFGVALGSIDVAMNIQAIIVERNSGQSMMSGFHGYFSFGGIAGAIAVTALLSAGASPFAATLCAIAGIVLALVAAAPDLLRVVSIRQGPAFAIPHGIVLFIGGLCFIMFLTEGAILDWSAVFLTSQRGVAASHAGLGYGAFALAMTIGRLAGDRIVQRLGRVRIITAGGLLAAAGLALATLIPLWQLAVTGYILVGIGCSNIVPVLYTSVGRQTVMAEELAVPAITTLGYAGILCGPATIGFVAHSASLSAAFLIVAVLLLGVAASGRLLRLLRI